ncbi:MAG: nitroreductase family protein [Schwartzia sp.]|nr:nitroreductase family protein [Schwartzia sp. (in: firmicutes)]
MDIMQLMKWCRSYRRFDQSRAIPDAVLDNIMEAARLSNSASNRQQLRFLVVRSPEMVEKIFPFTHWAAVLPKEAGQPKDGEHPALFVVSTYEAAEKAKWTDVDIGIAEMRMTLAAAAEGVGSCILANIERGPMREALGLPESTEIATIVAFGYPTHTSRIVDMKDGDVKYYLDEKKDYCVPKRSREELFRMV